VSFVLLRGKKVLIIGAARSGIAAARFLLAQGAIVALTDKKPIEQWTPEAVALKESGVGLLPGETQSWLLDQLDLVVVSPGVPATIIPIRYAERAGAEVIGEVELASRFLKGRIIGITGSNGKTTTTSLIGELLRDAGLPDMRFHGLRHSAAMVLAAAQVDLKTAQERLGHGSIATTADI